MAKSDMNGEKKGKSEKMSTTLTSRTADAGFWREMWRQARLAWHLIRSPEVPLYLKVLPVLAVIYVLLPTDFLPDVFPVIGQLDDITALIVGAKVFIELAPPEVVARYVQSIRGTGTPAPAADEAGAPSDGVEQGGDSESEEGSLEETIVIEGDYDVLDDEKEKDQAG